MKSKLLQQVDDAKKGFQLKHAQKIRIGSDKRRSFPYDPNAPGLASALDFIDSVNLILKTFSIMTTGTNTHAMALK